MRRILLPVVVTLLLGFLVWELRGYFPPMGSSESYFSGYLVYEDFNRCGLVRTRQADRRGCEMSAEVCGRLRDHINQRIRVSAYALACEDRNVTLRCSKHGEFNEGGFDPDECYSDVKLMKIFKAESGGS